MRGTKERLAFVFIGPVVLVVLVAGASQYVHEASGRGAFKRQQRGVRTADSLPSDSTASPSHLSTSLVREVNLIGDAWLLDTETDHPRLWIRLHNEGSALVRFAGVTLIDGDGTETHHRILILEPILPGEIREVGIPLDRVPSLGWEWRFRVEEQDEPITALHPGQPATDTHEGGGRA